MRESMLGVVKSFQFIVLTAVIVKCFQVNNSHFAFFATRTGSGQKIIFALFGVHFYLIITIKVIWR